MSAIQALDESILLWIRENLCSDVLTPFFRLVTRLGDAGLIWIVLGVLLLLGAASRRRGLVYLLALGFAAAVNNLAVKPLVERPRPYEAIAGFEPLVERLASYSFPSGHACASFAAATALTMLFGKRGAVAFIPAALIALSRPYLGMHYMSDVVCGALLGAVCAAAVSAGLRKIWRLD